MGPPGRKCDTINLDVLEKRRILAYMASAFSPKQAGVLGRSVTLSLAASVAFILANLLLVGVIVFTVYQNLTLRGIIDHDEALLLPARGSLMPSLLGTDRAGVTQNVTFGGAQQPTLFYSFTMHCPYCIENWRTMRVLQSLQRTRYALSISTTR